MRVAWCVLSCCVLLAACLPSEAWRPPRPLHAAEVTGLQRIGATLVFVTLKACTAQAPNWHPNADEFMYIVKGRNRSCLSLVRSHSKPFAL